MTTLPFKFVDPGKEEISAIGELLLHLPIFSEMDLVRELSVPEQVEARTGKLSEVCEGLRVNLIDDHEQLVAEAKNAAYLFEFVVDAENLVGEQFHAQGLGVWTRLFSHRQGGSVRYGRRVFRVESDKYLYWIE